MRASLLLAAAVSRVAFAQVTPPVDYGRSFGGQILVSDSGFGAGAFLRLGLGRFATAALELSVSPVRDARDGGLFEPGARIDREHHLLLAPLVAGLERRLFPERLVDRFRPFLLVAAGPVLAWRSPAYVDTDGNGARDTGEPPRAALPSITSGRPEAAFGAVVALGAHFGEGGGTTQGARIGIRATRILGVVRLVTPAHGPPVRTVVTPEIALYLGRLF